MRDECIAHADMSMHAPYITPGAMRALCATPAGLAVCLGYQALYTVPRWRRLVGAHLAATGTTGARALGLLAGFGAFYNVHNIAQVPELRRCSTSGARVPGNPHSAEPATDSHPAVPSGSTGSQCTAAVYSLLRTPPA